MENASKAIIIAGGILIALVIISLLVILFGQIGNIYSEQGESLSLQQMEEYNRKFATYDKSLYGSELLSLANLIDDYNNRLLYDENKSGTFYKENKIDVYVFINKDLIGYISSQNGKTYGQLKARSKAYEISDIKLCNDTMEQRLSELEKAGRTKTDEYYNIKSALTQLRSTPFRCISEQTKYNKNGRISVMYFRQENN